MKPRQNRLFEDRHDITTRLGDFEMPPPNHGKIKTPEEIRDLTRRQNAAELVAGLANDSEIFACSKGQFSLLDVMLETLAIIGPADLAVSTWTANHQTLAKLKDTPAVLSFRWVVDVSMNRRYPGIVEYIRTTWGPAAIRVTHNHSKFFTLSNDAWKVVCITSCNLNMNARMEHFLIANSPARFAYLHELLDRIFNGANATPATPRADVLKEFRENH